MKLDPFISELLYEHDCVIVADFGGFIASRKPASINSSLHLLTPPSKVIAFNSFLKQNDGVLANHIARKKGITYSDACKLIGDYVKLSMNAMEEGRRVKLENIGILYRDNNEIIQFLPDQNANYLVSSFGMSTVHAPVVQREEEPVSGFKQKTVRRISTGKSVQKKWRIIEVIPAAAMLTFLLMVPPVLDQFNSNLSSLLPFSRINEYIQDFKKGEADLKPVIHYQSPFEVPHQALVSTEATAINNTVAVESGTEAVKQEMPEPIAEVPVAVEPTTTQINDSATDLVSEVKTAASSSATWHIVGGCFRKEVNADRFIAELKSKGIEAEKAGTNAAGLTVVSVFRSDNRQQAMDALQEFKASVDSSVWVMEKK